MGGIQTVPEDHLLIKFTLTEYEVLLVGSCT